MSLSPQDARLKELEDSPALDAWIRQERVSEPALRVSARQAATAPPDRQAEIRSLTQSTGLPAVVIGRNLEAIRHRQATTDPRLSRIQTESPQLAEWLARPDNMAVASDDLESLGALDWTVRRGRDFLGGAIGEGLGLTLEGLGELTGVTTRALSLPDVSRLPETSRLRQLTQEFEASRNVPTAWWGDPAEILKVAGGKIREAGGEVATGDVTLPAQVSRGLGQMGFQILTALLTGGAATTATLLAQGAGVQAEQLEREGTGPGGGRDLAVVGGAAATALTERFGLDVLMNRLPASVRANAIGALTAVIGAGLSEGTQEVSEAVLHDVIRQGLTDADVTIGEGVIDEFTVAGITGALAETIILSVAGVHARGVRNQAQVLESAGAQVAASRTFGRFPEAVREMLRNATADQRVAIPVEAWQTYWQSRNEDPGRAAETFLGNRQAYTDAEATGADISVPLADYLTRIGPTEHNAAFAEEVRWAPDEMNAREATELEESLTEEVADVPRGTTVREDIVGQLVDRGFDRATVDAYASIYESLFTTLGARAGVEPGPLFSQYGLRVDRPLPEVLQDIGRTDDLDAMLDRIRAGDVPDQRSLFGTSLLDFLREKGGVRDEGGELAALEIDSERRPFQRKIVQEGGESLDLAREAAAEAGYLPADLTVADFLDLMEREARGKPVFSLQAEQGADFEAAQTLFQLRDYLDSIGLDLSQVTNQEARAVLMEAEQAGVAGVGEGVTFAQGASGDPLASFTIGSDRKINIKLLQGADLSSFLHESGHFFLEVFSDLHDQMAGLETRTAEQQGILDDYTGLLKWLGVESRDQIGSTQHEQFARGFEAYLREGRAPSSALRRVFGKFAAWLKLIYRDAGQLDVTLTPEVRGIFDRMIASDTEIAEAQREADIVELFSNQEDAGLTDPEWQAYRRTIEDASAQAQEELRAGALEAEFRAREAWWQDERVRVREDVARQVHTQRVYLVLSYLQRGMLPDGSALPEGVAAVKLDAADLERQYGKASRKVEGGERQGTRIMNALLDHGVYRREGGVAADVVAQQFGYSSGNEMVLDLVNARPMEALIDAETDGIMRERHPDALTDGSLHERALAAVHGEKRSEVILAELRALAKKQREVRPFVRAERQRVAGERRSGLEQLRAAIPPLAVVRQMAQGHIAQQRARDIQPQRYLVAARKAGQRAIEAAAKQDWAAALLAKQQQLINTERYRAAMTARDEVEAIYDYARGFQKKATRQRLGKAGEDYLDQIDGLLGRFEFARVSQKVLARRQRLSEWIAAKARQGIPVNLPAEMVDEANRTNYREMTVEQLRGLRDSLKHIEHVAQMKNRLLKAKDRRELDAVKAGLVTSIDQNSRGPRELDIETRAPGTQATRLVEGFFAANRKLNSYIRQMDGGKDGGAMWESIMRPVNEAADAETERQISETARYAEILGIYTKTELAELSRREFIPAIRRSLSKEARLIVALNWGNRDNRQRLMGGYGWDEAQVNAILDGLSEKDWQFVEAVWTQIDAFWPEIEAKQKRVEGIAPEKVEALPFQTRYGEVRGGYFPIRFDSRQDPTAYAQEMKEQADAMMRGAFTRAMTKHGFVEERAKFDVKRPVRLDLGVVWEHVGEVIHDLTHHEMLIDVNRILGSRDVSGAIIRNYGDVVYGEMRDAIRDVAQGDMQAGSAVNSIIAWARKGTSIARMGFNTMTAMVQPLGLTVSVRRIGAKWVARGMARWIGSAARMESGARFVQEKSAFMKSRSRTMEREIREIRSKIRPKGSIFLSDWGRRIAGQTGARVGVEVAGKYNAVEDSYFWLISRAQMIADIPTWLGAYEKAMADATNTEERAIALADQAVIDSQGSGHIKDLTKFQRGLGGAAGPATEFVKVFTQFMGYFSVVYNQAAEARAVARIGDMHSMGRLAVDMLMLFTVPMILETVIRDALRGGGDDDEDLMKRLAVEQAAYIMNTVPFFREFTGPLQGFPYEGPAGLGLFAEAGSLIQQAQQGEADAAAVKALNETTGILFHYPATEVQRALDAYTIWEEENGGAALRALVAGKPRQ